MYQKPSFELSFNLWNYIINDPLSTFYHDGIQHFLFIPIILTSNPLFING